MRDGDGPCRAAEAMHAVMRADRDLFDFSRISTPVSEQVKGYSFK
jgi:hypothetical protein